MGDDFYASIPPELRVVMDLEITIQNLSSVSDHQRLQDALTAVAGVECVYVWENKVGVRYDPERVSRHQLHEIVVREGFVIGGEDSAPPAPSVDSV